MRSVGASVTAWTIDSALAATLSWRELHALGLAGAAAGEDDRRHVVERMPAQPEDDAFEEPARQRGSPKAAPAASSRRVIFGQQVVEVDQLDARAGVERPAATVNRRAVRTCVQPHWRRAERIESAGEV